jgi:hypothetical protein
LVAICYILDFDKGELKALVRDRQGNAEVSIHSHKIEKSSTSWVFQGSHAGYEAFDRASEPITAAGKEPGGVKRVGRQ